MGVKGLWRLLLPIGRRISLETLEGKLLAVDASIWMTQFIKAMRDPESGAIRPAAHIIGFFRRLCRLRFHGIRPVFVFDGATPEIKRRELRDRRRRRDQFVATHGAAAVQRMAKRLLVEQLKKAKAKTMVNSNKGVKIQLPTTSAGGESAANNGNNDGDGDDGDGAFVAGFNLPEHARIKNSKNNNNDNNNGENQATSSDSALKEVIDIDMDANDNDNSQFEIHNGEIIITSKRNKKGDSNPEVQAAATTSGGIDDENDWDKPIVVDEEGNNEQDDDNDENNNGNDNDKKKSDQDNDDNDEVEYDNVLWTSRQRNRKKSSSQRHGRRRHNKKSDDDLLDTEYVLSLNPVDRKDAIEEAQKRQRMRSRKEFLPVAANAAEYSQTQLRNFLRSSKLNKDIVKMAKKAVDVDSKLHGEVMASDRTRRVIFEKDTDDKESNNNNGDKGKRRGGDSDDDYTSNDSDIDDKSSDDGGFLKTTERPTNARRKMTKQQRQHQQQQQQQQQHQQQQPNSPTADKRRHKLRKVGWSAGQENDSDEEGEGFFTSQPEKSKDTPQSSHSKRRVIADDDDDGEDSGMGGGFVPSSSSTKDDAATMTSERGFARSNKKPPPPPPPPPPQTEENTFTGSDKKRAHFSDSEDSDPAEGFASTQKSKHLKHPKSVNKQQYSAKAASAVALFRSRNDDNDDDSSQDGGGFLTGKPVPNRAQLKTTGLEDEVIVIDDNETFGNDNDSGLLSGDAAVAQELQDRMLAKALQEEEDANMAARYAASAGVDSDNEAADKVTTVSKKQSWGFHEPVNNILPGERTREGILTARVANNELLQPLASTMLDGEGDSEDEDIEWENGDGSVDDAGPDIADETSSEIPANAHTAPKLPTGDLTKRSAAHNGPDITGTPLLRPTEGSDPRETISIRADGDVDEDEDEDDVPWEDGDDAKKKEAEANKSTGDHIARMIGKSGTQQVQGQESAISSAPDSEFESNDYVVDTTEGNDAQEVQRLDSAFDDDVDEAMGFSSRLKVGQAFSDHHEEDTAAALEQAEATAANLTNWAGRAVRLAIAEHLRGDGGARSLKDRIPARYDIELNNEENESMLVADSDTAKKDDKSSHHELVVNEDHAQEAAQMLEEYENELQEGSRDNIEREIDTVTDEMQEEIMQLLQLFGVPYVQAPAEAEAQCVALEKLGLVSGIVTEDSDVFVFGGKTVYKNIFDDQKYVEVYLTDDAEREMGLGQNEMVALAMLLGGDYTEGVKGVGIVNGMEIVTSFDVSKDLKEGLQNFRSWLDGFEPIVEANARKDSDSKSLTKEQRFHIKHRTARTRWIAPENFPSDAVISAYVNPVVDQSTTRFTFGVPDMDNLITFCNKHAGWLADDTRRLLEPVIEKVENKTRQTRIENFMKYEDGITFAAVRSKRLRDVLGEVQKESETSKTKNTGKKRKKEGGSKDTRSSRRGKAQK